LIVKTNIKILETEEHPCNFYCAIAPYTFMHFTKTETGISKTTRKPLMIFSSHVTSLLIASY